MPASGERRVMGGTGGRPPEWLSTATDERVLLRAEPSKNLVLAALTAGFVLLLAMSVLVSALSDLRTGRAVSFAGLVVIVGLIVGASLVVQRREYVLTDERACVGVGFRDERVASIDLADVEGVTVEQSVWQRLVNVGTLRFVGVDRDLAFSFVEEPLRVHARVLGAVDEGGCEVGAGGVVPERA